MCVLHFSRNKPSHFSGFDSTFFPTHKKKVCLCVLNSPSAAACSISLLLFRSTREPDLIRDSPFLLSFFITYMNINCVFRRKGNFEICIHEGKLFGEQYEIFSNIFYRTRNDVNFLILLVSELCTLCRLFKPRKDSRIHLEQDWQDSSIFFIGKFGKFASPPT